MSQAQMTPVFPQGLVPPVVQTIFDIPVSPHSLQKTLGTGLV